MPPSIAQRLGFAPDDRVAVIHCDDIGMCHSANEGAFEALLSGPATCVDLSFDHQAFSAEISGCLGSFFLGGSDRARWGWDAEF